MSWSDYPCVEWDQYRDKNGYGRTRFQGRKMPAHRVVWIKTYGSIPDGLIICHHCDNPPCLRIEHLFLGTHKDNAQDRDRKGRGGEGNRKHGVERPNARLTPEAVIDIRSNWVPGVRGYKANMATKYGVKTAAVHAVLMGRTWKRVQP